MTLPNEVVVSRSRYRLAACVDRPLYRLLHCLGQTDNLGTDFPDVNSYVISRFLSALSRLATPFAVLVAAGCASQSQQLQMPPVPEPRVDAVNVPVAFPPLSNLGQNTVQVPYADIPVTSTVVIALGNIRPVKTPVDFAESSSLVREELQKELIRQGFRVLDQGRLDNLLMSLAQDRKCGERAPWWRCTSLLEAGEVAYLDSLEKRRDAGQLTPEVFVRELEQARGIWRARATSNQALMAAIESGELAADYVLEVEKFAPGETRQSVNLADIRDIRRLLNNYPDLQEGFAARQYVRCSALATELKARLVKTASGEVVWFGNHGVSELSRTGSEVVVEVGVKRSVVNVEEVAEFVEAHNSGAVKRRGKNVSLPGWRYADALVGPSLLRGSCSLANRQRDELQKVSNQITARVVRELVDTIHLTGNFSVPAQAPLKRAPVFQSKGAPLTPNGGGGSSPGTLGPAGPVPLN